MADDKITLLWLANSDDVGDFTPIEGRAYILVAKALEAELGRKVEVVVRSVWPAPELPEIIGRWMEKYRPDLVLFKVNSFWYLYRSVPLQLQRRFGWFGKAASSAGKAAARRRWISERWAFHAVRGLLLRTVGGASYFTVAEVVATVEVCTRRMLRHEDVGIVLHPTIDRWTSNPVKQKQGHDAMKAFAASVHVTYLGADPFDPADWPPKDFYTGRDRLHSNEEANQWIASRQAEALLEAWKRSHPGE